MSKKKVALIGNMNNNMFAMARYLRDEGVDAELLLFENELDHFHPSCDTYNDEYLNYTKTIPWNYSISPLWNRSKNDIRKDIENYDIIIGCGPVPAYLYKIGRNIDIFVPYGGDIYEWPFFKHYKFLINYRWLKFNIKKFYRDLFAKLSIPNAKMIHAAHMNHFFETQIKSLVSKEKRYTYMPPMVYVPMLQEMSEPSITIKKIRDSNDFVFVQHCQQDWKMDYFINGTVYSRGNDILIRAFQMCLTENKDKRIKLILFEYGPGVEKSKNLISELKIEDFVIWHPKTERKNIFPILNIADACIAELGMSFYSYGTMQEALAVGVPLIMNRDSEVYQHLGMSLYPALEAKDINGVFNHLNNIVIGKLNSEEIRLKSKEWYHQNTSVVINKYLDFIYQ